MKQFEYKGFWWLSSNPDNKIPGILKYHPTKGSSLDLFGPFYPITNSNTNREELFIHGITANDKYVTLYKNYVTQLQISLGGGFPTTSYTSNYIFIGYHFDSVEELIFSSFSIGYYFLEEWAGISGFQVELNSDTSGKISKHQISYEFPENVIANVENCKIELTYSFSSPLRALKEASMKQSTYFRLEFHSDISFDEFMNKINYLLQNFISFGIGRFTRPTFIKANKNDVQYELPDKSKSKVDIEIYYTVGELPDQSRGIEHHEMNLPLSSIGSYYELCMQHWFSKEELLRPVYDLYFSVINTSTMFLSHEFINLTHALEAYHRKMIGGKFVSDSEYNIIKDQLILSIPDTVSSEFRESLKMKFNYLNEYSLRKRLRNILEGTNPITSKYISDNDDFISKVVNTRNYLTHFDHELKEKAVSGEALYWMCQRIKLIVEVLFMSELGLPNEAINDLHKRNDHLRILLNK